ncbi:MAG TPA: 5-formyltetrahydrofolate cyclo-ligase [Pedobacter sp.]
MNKIYLRKNYLQKRKELSPNEREALSTEIVDRFKEISFVHHKFIHTFYPITGKQEFNSLLLKNKLEMDYPHLQFLLPKANLVEHTLSHILWEKDTPLAMNQWGITEPECGTEISVQEIDAVIAPLLAFDTKGNRLGYGKGFYDRFLADCRIDILKLGVSYFEPEQAFEEVEEYDIPLDICVTPSKVWYFNKAHKKSGL